MGDVLQYLLSGLVTGSIYGLIGVGFTGIYNATGIVNFAQGDFAMVGAMVAIALSVAGAPLPLAVVLAIVAVAALGGLIERFAVRPARQDVVRGIVVTIGIGVVLQGTVAAIWGTDAFPLPAFSGDEPLDIGGATVPSQALWVIGIAAASVLALQAFFQKTYIGKLFRASAVNPLAATLVGIDTRTASTVSFVISGALGALAGIIVAPITLMQYDAGLGLGIKGFVACIIGGFGNPLGAALGGVLLGLLEAVTSGYLSSGYKNAIAFVLLLAFLFFRPGGILNDLERGKH